jgi:hypothetical protein
MQKIIHKKGTSEEISDLISAQCSLWRSGGFSRSFKVFKGELKYFATIAINPVPPFSLSSC